MSKRLDEGCSYSESDSDPDSSTTQRRGVKI
jgi:hypothetical protein